MMKEKCYLLPVWEKTLEDSDKQLESSTKGVFINHFYFHNNKYPIFTHKEMKVLARDLLEKGYVERIWIDHAKIYTGMAHPKELVAWAINQKNLKVEPKRELSEIKQYNIQFQTDPEKIPSLIKYLRQIRYNSDYFCIINLTDSKYEDTQLEL